MENENGGKIGGTPTPSVEGHETNSSKIFSKEDVNEIVKSRIDRILGKCGVDKTEELEAFVSKGKSYDELKKKYDDLNTSFVFKENNISKDREDDVKTYFKGKGFDLNSNLLAELVKTHPEWVNQGESKVGSAQTNVQGKQAEKELEKGNKEKAEELFGFKFR